MVKWAAKAKANSRTTEEVVEATEEEVEVEEVVEAGAEAIEVAVVDFNKMVKVDQEVHAVLLTRHKVAQNKDVHLIHALKMVKIFNLKIIFNHKDNNPSSNSSSSKVEVE